jgi:hypothetical protein
MVLLDQRATWQPGWVLTSLYSVGSDGNDFRFPKLLQYPCVYLARLLRHASLYGPLERTGEELYRHTPFSLVYLRPEIRGMFRFAWVSYPSLSTNIVPQLMMMGE